MPREEFDQQQPGRVSPDKAAGQAQGKSEFERLGGSRQYSLAEEFWFFLRENKKWWMTPILVVFALMGLLIVLAATGAAPFIYTLF